MRIKQNINSPRFTNLHPLMVWLLDSELRAFIFNKMDTKTCSKLEYHREWKKNNPEKVKASRKRYYKKHILEIKKRAKENAEKKAQYRKEYYQKNAKRICAKTQKYYIENKEKCKAYNKIYRQIHKKELNIREQEKRNNPIFRLNHSITNSINKSLKRQKNGYHWENLVDYNREDLIQHLEAQFKDGMTWENYGRNGWHIDHRIPISLFNITGVKSKGFKKCWALENLQPLWEKENIKKHNKLFS